MDPHPRRSARPHPWRRRLRRRRRRVRQRRAEHRLGHARRGQEGRQARRPSGPTTSTTSTRASPTTRWASRSSRRRRRPLYGYKPEDAVNAVPDLAEAEPEISEDGKTVTVKIKPGVKFSPPVDREVTSKDVKYAIERGFFNTVNNGYAGAYFGDLEGAKVGAKPGAKISGIKTPDDQTIVFNLTKGTGGVVAGALALPLSAPVPEEYAAKFDAENPSDVRPEPGGDGPYMIENDASGKAIGYQAGRRIHLVRNPNWDAEHRLPPGLPGRDRHAAGQRRHHGGVAQDPRGREHDQRRLLAGARRCSSRSLTPSEGAARAVAERRRPLGRDEHDDQAVRQRRTCAGPWSPASTARRCA